MVSTVAAFHGFVIPRGLAVPSYFTGVFITVIEALPVTCARVLRGAETDLWGHFLFPEATFYNSFGSSL